MEMPQVIKKAMLVNGVAQTGLAHCHHVECRSIISKFPNFIQESL